MTSSNPNRLPKALSPNTITLGLRLQREFWTGGFASSGHTSSLLTPEGPCEVVTHEGRTEQQSG